MPCFKHFERHREALHTRQFSPMYMNSVAYLHHYTTKTIVRKSSTLLFDTESNLGKKSP